MVHGWPGQKHTASQVNSLWRVRCFSLTLVMTQISTPLYVNWQFFCSLPPVLFIRCCSPPHSFSIKNVANYTSSSMGSYVELLKGCVIRRRLQTTAGLFSYLTDRETHGGPLALIYQCEWVADLTELLELMLTCTKCKSVMKAWRDWCASVCANCCLSSPSGKDRKCLDSISIDLTWLTLGMNSKFIFWVLCVDACYG